MSFMAPNFAAAAPEMVLLALVCIVLVVDVWMDDARRYVTYALSQVSLLVTTVVVITGFGTDVVSFDGHFVRDPMADVLKVATLLVVAAVFLYSRDYLKVKGLTRGEFYTLGLFATLGMMVMISAHSFLTVYLGLELLSLSLYALVAFDRDSGNAAEAAMKYFVLGALASGMLLYGISMFYGATGSIDLAAIGGAVAEGSEGKLILAFALAFVVVGLAFKLGAVPFHMWLPDVYQGAPTPVTLFVGSAPKIAAFALVMRVLADGLGGLLSDWGPILAVLAALSLALGNLVAIAQTQMRRMLAYSTISHVGFILLGVLTGTAEGYAAAMFYTITYAIMVLGAFGIMLVLGRAGIEIDHIEDLKGLNERSSWLAVLMLLVMMSMAGIPPLVGFWAKLYVLEAAVAAGYTALAVFALVTSVIGAFYYLRVVKFMYFDSASDDRKPAGALDTQVLISANGLAMVGLGVYPAALFGLCLLATRAI